MEKTDNLQLHNDSEKKQTNFYFVVRELWKNKLAVLGIVIVAVLILLSILAPLISPYPYAQVNPLNANQTPSWEHPFGTDALGRDILSRCLYGGRYSLSLGIISQLFTVVLGTVIGAFASYAGGKVDNVVMRVCDIIQSIPSILLSICTSQTLGPGFASTVIALSIATIPANVRTIRAQILKVREQEYVEAAQAINCSKARIVFKHIIPNAISPTIISCAMGIGGKIQSAAGLSYLGLGIQPPTPEWGAMLSDGKAFLRYYPHLVVFPGMFIIIVTLAFNLFGDGLRDALDPKLRK